MSAYCCIKLDLFINIVLMFVYFIIADIQILLESQQTGFTQTNISVLIAVSEDIFR